MFLSSWHKERANGNLRAALAALAHGLEVSLLKSATARMPPILVVHGQIDDERHLTCHFGMLSASAISNGRWAVATATPPTLRCQDHIVAQAQRAVPRA